MRTDGPAEKSVRRVSREDLPSVHSVVVDDVEHNLGVLKELTKSPEIARFMPSDCRVSIAWVRLDPGEVLEVHTHPVDSMILVCQGNGRSIGDLEGTMGEGDAVLVPAGRPHGFVGASPEGFWGLSLQFESRGLYEDLDDPWASFDPAEVRWLSDPEHPLDALLQENEWHEERFAKHRLFTLAGRGVFADPTARSHFLDCLKVWSTYFQRVLQARACLTSDPHFFKLAQRHLADELGHDQSLGARRDIWDPLLDALGSWFVFRVMSSTDVERVVLVHLVLEKAALMFYERMAPLFNSDSSQAADHFVQHAQDDGDHVQIGIDLLRLTPLTDLARLQRVQKTGWDMMRALLTRITQLVLLQ